MADVAAIIPERCRPALADLLTAYDYAMDGQVDRWQFAIELTGLLASGATLADVRWLIARRLAEHGKEITIPGDAQRSFRLLAVTSFPPDTCLTLAPDGAAIIRRVVGSRPADTSDADNLATSRAKPRSAPSQESASRNLPQWIADRRELRYKNQVVKRYRVPAPNQALVLAAFQEMGWPHSIDDPLPPAHDQDSKHRLQATVKSLNRNQRKSLIRFHGNGNGRQICWEHARAR
jgi:hypothetical protein